MVGMTWCRLSLQVSWCRNSGRYKPFIVVSPEICNPLRIFSLVTLTVDSPYWHQAVIFMAFAGIGIGMTMPILSLAVQNEFENVKDLDVLLRRASSFSGALALRLVQHLQWYVDYGWFVFSWHNQQTFLIQLRQSPQLLEESIDDIDADVLP